MVNKDKEISIIIPVYNERDVISAKLKEVNDFMREQGYTYEIIVIDDGSSDETSALLDGAAGSLAFLKIIRNPRNRGKGYSIKKGILEAEGRYIIFMDADLSTPLSEIKTGLRYFDEGYDIIIGSRNLQESEIACVEPYYRKISRKVLNYIVRIFIINDFKDTQCGFKCFKKEIARRVFSLQRLDRFGFDIEVLYIAKQLKCRVKEMPIVWNNRNKTAKDFLFTALILLADVLKIKLNTLKKLYLPKADEVK